MTPTLRAAVLCLAAAVGTAWADGPELVDVRVERNGDRFVASGQLRGGLTSKVLEEIEAGLETTITYRLQVHRRRPGLPDLSVGKQKIRTTVRRDALTRQYSLTRRVDGEVQETKVTDEVAVMKEFMTLLEAVPVLRLEDLPPEKEYYLKAKANIGLVWRFYLIPWPLDTDWVRVPLRPPEGPTGDAQP